MRTRIVPALLLAILAGSPLWAQEWAGKMFETTTHDFGSVAPNSKTEYEFKLKNRYVKDVHIASVRSSCGCTSPRIKKAWLKTHEEGAIIAKINTDTFRDSKGATLTVTIDRPLPAQVQLHVKVFIRDYDFSIRPRSIQLGSVEQGTAVEETLEVRFTGRTDLRIVGVRSANDHLSGKVSQVRSGSGEVSYLVRVRLDENAPAGYLQNHLMLVANDQRQTEIPVLVAGRVMSKLTVSPASLNLGPVMPGQKVRKQLLVQGKKPFRIKGVTADGDRFEFGTPPDAAPKAFHLIPVTYTAGGDPGKVVRTIRIETDLGDAPTELHASALVLPEEEAEQEK